MDRRAQARVQRRLEEAAQAFRTLYDTMRASFRPPQNDNDVATVFDRAACQVCRSCTLRANCWERDYVSTFDALNNAAQPMLDRGRGEPGDFPQHFSSRCIHFPDFLAAVNREVTALLYRRQYNSRIQDSRQAVCRQYGELSSLLGRAAAELGRSSPPIRPPAGSCASASPPWGISSRGRCSGTSGGSSGWSSPARCAPSSPRGRRRWNWPPSWAPPCAWRSRSGSASPSSSRSPSWRWRGWPPERGTVRR